MSLSPKVINLDFAEIIIYPDFLVSTIKEGVVFGKEHLRIFNRLFKENYPNKKFGYISDRKNDYTVDPICYLETNRYKYLVGLAIYCHTEASYNNTMFEKTFNKQPFEGFYSLKECEVFIKNIISE